MYIYYMQIPAVRQLFCDQNGYPADSRRTRGEAHIAILKFYRYFLWIKRKPLSGRILGVLQYRKSIIQVFFICRDIICNQHIKDAVVGCPSGLIDFGKTLVGYIIDFG